VACRRAMSMSVFGNVRWAGARHPQHRVLSLSRKG
jgi:hypothetical protein